jgi:hypothetical protein
MGSRACAWVSLLWILCFGISLPRTAHSGDNSAVPARKVIRADTAPKDGVHSLRMRELWHTNPDAPEYLFGFIDAAVADHEGRVYLLDRQVGDVKVFSPEGRFLRTVSGRGEGPGETQMPKGLALAPDGGLGVFEEFPGRMAFLDRDGNGTGSWVPRFTDSSGPPLIGFKHVLMRGSRIYVSYGRLFLSADPKEEVTALAAFDARGDLQATFQERRRVLTTPSDVDLAYRGFYAGQWDVDARGRLCALENTGDYRIAVHDSTGAIAFVLERGFHRRERTQEEIERIREAFSMEEGSPGRIAESAPAIRMLHLAANGELWVLTDAPAAALTGAEADGPIAARCDVFSDEGEYLREVVIRGDVDWERDKWIWVSDERVIILREHASAVAFKNAALKRVAAQADGKAVASEVEPGEEMTVVCFVLDGQP